MPKKSKLIQRARKAKLIRQVAAIPFRLNEDGKPEVMLVTSRSTQRFIIPKGWPMKGKSNPKVAAIEARQEAGVTGKVLDEPIGSYSYWKRLADCFVPVEVTVYVVNVEDVASKWDEQRERRRAWLGIGDAVALIDEPELAAIIAQADFPALLDSGRSA
jgi:8-oxo-dGTP pyrophosphatase MutT (NUDIX family)